MKIESLQDYISLIGKLQKSCTYDVPVCETDFGDHKEPSTHTVTPQFIYRGHNNRAEYTLTPGIMRYKYTRKMLFIPPYSAEEMDILYDFISEACRFINDISVNDTLAWLEIAQHFGIPTRLLDFSENPLIALYVACTDSLGNIATKENGCVWIVNSTSYNKKFHNIKEISTDISISLDNVKRIIRNMENNSSSEMPEYPYIYKPYHRKERMSAQASVFMLWGKKIGPLTDIVQADDYIVECTEKQHDKILCEIEIPKARKETIVEQLNLCGVNQKLMYPGLDGVGRYIRAKYCVPVENALKQSELSTAFGHIIDRGRELSYGQTSHGNP